MRHWEVQYIEDIRLVLGKPVEHQKYRRFWLYGTARKFADRVDAIQINYVSKEKQIVLKHEPQLVHAADGQWVATSVEGPQPTYGEKPQPV